MQSFEQAMTSPCPCGFGCSEGVGCLYVERVDTELSLWFNGADTFVASSAEHARELMLAPHRAHVEPNWLRCRGSHLQTSPPHEQKRFAPRHAIACSVIRP